MNINISKHLEKVLEYEAKIYNVTLENYILTIIRLHVNGIEINENNLKLVFNK